MKGFDLLQSLFSHQPVFRAPQVKQRDVHLTNFEFCVTGYDSPCPLREDFGAYGTHGVSDSKLQALGCTMPDEKIFEYEIG